MDNHLKKRIDARRRRVFRVRKRTKGSGEKPRLTVSKTNKHIYVQLIDDNVGKTLFGLGTLSKESKKTDFNAKSKDSAKYLGTQIAEKALKSNIKEVVFDRGRFKFHGVVKELANAARAAGLKF